MQQSFNIQHPFQSACYCGAAVQRVAFVHLELSSLQMTLLHASRCVQVAKMDVVLQKAIRARQILQQVNNQLITSIDTCSTPAVQ
jgi:hypothetical protein